MTNPADSGAALNELRKYAKIRRIDSDYVFPSVDCKRPFSFRPHWNAALGRTAIEDFRFHDLRHTAAGYLAMNGATLLEIADVLGHKTLGVLPRYHGRLS